MRARVLLSVTGLLLTLAGVGIGTAQNGIHQKNGASISGPLTRVSDVRSLEPAAAEQGLPVRLEATVTHVDTVWHLLFVQDDTGGLFVQPHRPNETPPLFVRPGDRIRVTGRTQGGGFAPYVVESEIEKIGAGKLPAAPFRPIDDLFTGQHDSQYLRTRGRVVDLYVDRFHLRLTVAQGSDEISARIPYVEKIPEGLWGSRVELEGVAGTLLNEQNQLRGIYLAVASLGHLTVIDPAEPDPFALPSETARTVLAFDPDPNRNSWVHLEGRVTYFDRSGRIFIEDSTGGIEVRGRNLGTPSVGERIEVVGFPRASERAPVLRYARSKSHGAVEPVTPLSVTLGEAGPTGLNGRLVSLEGRIVGRSEGSDYGHWVLRSDDHLVHTHLSGRKFEGSAEPPPARSRVRMTGVLSMPAPPLFEEEQFGPIRLYLRSPADVQVLDRPPWWTARRALVLAGVLGVLCLLGIGWIYTLRRSVREKTATIRKKMAVENKLRKQAQQAADAREEVMSHLHHEIRSPLTSVIGYSDLLLEQVDEKHQDFLERVQEGARQVMNLAERMLNYTRLEAGAIASEPDHIEVIEVVLESARNFIPEARRKGLSLEIDAPDGPIRGYLDATFLGQIVRNLTGNAIDYTEEGTVYVGVERTTDPSAGIRLIVEDTGPGLTDEEQDTIFEAFRQGSEGKKVQRGLGLGLHITRRLVKHMNGRIDLQSEPGEGTRFEVVIPLEEETDAGEAEGVGRGGVTAGRDGSPGSPR